MTREQAIYVAELIECILREPPQTVFGNARDRFMLSHGAFGLKMLFQAERAMRKEWQIPDSTGNVDIIE